VQRGFYVTVTTNGTLITKARARSIAAIASDRLHFNISLDGTAETHDQIRSVGMWKRAIEGYQRIREADREVGNARRKILANTILHVRNAQGFGGVLDEQAALGFDGVRVLNLFRSGPEVPSEARDLWFRDENMPHLENTVTDLIERRRQQSPSGYRIQNPEADLARIPAYYRDELTPLDTPCWAGWKELYINADGQAIMCDGQLDFLSGAFGNVREETLVQLWNSPKLAARRRVVKQCTTPCIQECYLRPESDSATQLLAETASRGTAAATHRVLKLVRRTEHHPDTTLRLELTDVCPCDWEGCQTPQHRWKALTRQSPESPGPTRWNTLRDRGYLDFGRGFMGMELVRAVVDDLRRSRLRFGTLDLRWRGEPLLHPDIQPILWLILEAVQSDGIADRVRVHTDSVFLTPEVAALAGHPAPQEWVVDWDRGTGEGWQAIAAHRGENTRLVLAASAVEGLPLTTLQTIHPDLPVRAGPFPTRGDALWLRRTDHDHYLANGAAEARLATLAQAVDSASRPSNGQENHPPSGAWETTPKHQCIAPGRTPTISWDGKVTLCPTDTTLDNWIGEVTEQRFSEIWAGTARKEALRDCGRAGVPNRKRCQTCATPSSPNKTY